jgi:hypothetical protein
MSVVKQVKISVAPELAESFKTACVSAGVSMAAEISKFMADRSGVLSSIADKNTKKSNIDTRGNRRRQICLIVAQLEVIRDKEHAYMDKIPENLQNGQAYENAEQSVDALEQAIELLKEAY